MSDINSDINNLLSIDYDDKDKRTLVPEELELNSLPVITKHTVVTSPWSRLGIIAVPFGLSFLAIFWLLNGIFNPAQQPIKTTKQQQNSSETLDKVEQKDGDVYALLALDQQEEELSKINSLNKTQKPQLIPKTNRTQNIASNPTPPTPRLVQRYNQPETLKTTTTSRTKEPLRSFVSARANPTSSITSIKQTKALDPTAEFNRLRNIGSFGRIAYVDNTIGESQIADPLESSQSLDPALLPAKLQQSGLDAKLTDREQEVTENSIEKILPRWQLQSLATKSVTEASYYLPQEDQIIEERQTRYLTVGEFASGVLVTPAVKQDRKNNTQLTDDGKRFVAKLTQDLRDNYGNVAIPTGSLLAVEVVSVDGGNAQLQVTSIIKDKTEYPISSGAIAVLGSGGKPLIAKKFQGIGGEIARYDLTVGLVGGLVKVGEVINQPDVQQSIQNGGIGFSSNTTIQNNRRNIGGAFLNGAFGKLGNVISNRAERSNQEISARPNVWYIKKGTKVTFLVNRTLELP
ncbi:TrbI/VirB10 family protein [Dendronalium sp. ChiSLP03b]|uniref:TrbI/VirB10 family protein n=1 Tax=Dendronalium sp. ChiSLP03b TaxID=3075381 RepID=UPI002AD54509|nr:TrbI/VirB10 family protein [Dendronalium sp. ChiSLP03b]MDZ8203524.1 TrbI/VirB10 family protein [Dendronalium sp. ChiSLP03b]